MFRKKVLTRNGINITRNGAYTYRNVEFPDPIIPNDMHFIYLANDFDGTKIPNKATETTLGDYLQNGTLVKNGSGADCYISGGSNSNYLYVIMSDADLNLMKATSNTYTFYFRFVITSNSTGGLLCWRNAPPGYSGDGYNFMFRCASAKIEFHTSGGNNTNLPLTTDTVYKAVVTNTTCYIVDLNDATKTYSYSGSFTRTMKPKMTSLWAGYSSEAVSGNFYAVAGIARATTDEEDEAIKTYLMTQGV